MKRLLWIGDAACGSGFARASHHILNELMDRWEIAVIGVNYRGDPHDEKFKVYPAWIGGDILGVGRVDELLFAFGPDLVVMQTNPWNVPRYMEHLKKRVPAVGIIAVEGKNCRGDQLNELSHAIFWNEFSRQEAEQGGYTGTSGVAPLGVDLAVFHPGDRLAARKYLFPNHPETWDAFIVGNVNRNQNRKRIDLSIKYFAEWWKAAGQPNAYLYLHVLPGSTRSCDCKQLALYYGLKGRVVISEPTDVFNGAPEEILVKTYQSFDVFLTTTYGEGHGLTPMEAAACGIPVVAGAYAALGEWGQDALYLVAVGEEGVMPDVNNMLGAAPTRDGVVAALDALYRSQPEREFWGERGRARVNEPRFSWTHIGQRFAEEIERAVTEQLGAVR